MNIEVHVARDGDGWLVIDTAEWIEDKLGGRDDELTTDLQDWAANDYGGWSADCRTPVQWARDRFGDVRGPSTDDDQPIGFHSANQENLLDEDLCVWFIAATDDDGIEDTLVVINHDSVHHLAPHQDWVEIVDWARAWGGCPHGHTFVLESAVYLHSDTNQTTHRLTELCREDDPDDPGDAGYVACPDCPTDAQPSPIGFTA